MADKPRGMRLKFVLSQLRLCTHESKNRFIFFKSLKFYCEQESVKSNPVKLGGVSFNLVPRSHPGRGRSGYEIRGRLKRALLKVARYSFSGSMPPKFEHKLRRHKESFGKIAITVVLDKDENLL